MYETVCRNAMQCKKYLNIGQNRNNVTGKRFDI